MGERLQKFLARAGVASRRDCEALITSGRVKVNQHYVRELGTRVDPAHDHVWVDDRLVKAPDDLLYILLHKPRGVVSTVDDPQGRPTVVELVKVQTRVFPVGRLDTNSEGLLLLTNDGALTHHLTHPRFEVEKEYHALLDRPLAPEALQAWRSGVLLDGRRTAPAQVTEQRQTPEGCWISVVLREGRKRQIREVARLLGSTVRRLVRVREGSLLLGHLPVGQWRVLRAEEVQTLYAHLPTAQIAAPAPPADQRLAQRKKKP